MNQPRLFDPDGTAVGGLNGIAVGLAIAGQRIELGRQDHRRRQAGKIGVLQRGKARIATAVLPAGAQCVIKRHVPHA